jgi:Protein of unknown function (DUF3108)
MPRTDAIIKPALAPVSNGRPSSLAISHRPSRAVLVFGGSLWGKRIAYSRACFQCLAYCLNRAAHSAGLWLLLLTTALAAGPDRIEMRIEMFGIAGVHVATNRTIVEEATERYAITTDVESQGIGAVFINLTSHSEVRGRLTNTAARPQVYLGEVHRNGVVSRNRVQYATDGAVTAESTPPAETRTPVTPPLMRGTVDQLTAFFMIERQLAYRGSCALVVAVFDGRRRYDLHFTDVAPEAAPATADRNFAGATQVCRMRREAIAGFLDDSGRTEGAYEGKLWFARLVQGDLMIPVQMEFSTEFGTVTGHLAELHGRGVHLQFTK